jgi:hypothetical protein
MTRIVYVCRPYTRLLEDDGLRKSPGGKGFPVFLQTVASMAPGLRYRQ